MDAICIRDLKRDLKKNMDESRYEHTLGVMYTAGALAMRYECDLDKALLAGLMHDCAKCMPNAKKLKVAEKHGLEITEIEQKNPFMLHAKVGALLAEKKYDIEDRLLFIFHLSSFLSSFQVYLLFFLSDADRSAIHLSVC